MFDVHVAVCILAFSPPSVTFYVALCLAAQLGSSVSEKTCTSQSRTVLRTRDVA